MELGGGSDKGETAGEEGSCRNVYLNTDKNPIKPGKDEKELN